MIALRRLLVGWAFAHLFLVTTVGVRDVAWMIRQGYTLLPPSTAKHAHRVEVITDVALGHGLAASNRLRQSLTMYIHSAGIDSGYAFFAPNVPNSYKIVFELHYPNGEIGYDLPHISEKGSAVRLSTVLDYIGRTNYDPLRETMLKMLTQSIWRAHPEAVAIRTIFGLIQEPTLAEAREGKKESYKVIYVYDFTLSSAHARGSSQ